VREIKMSKYGKLVAICGGKTHCWNTENETDNAAYLHELGFSWNPAFLRFPYSRRPIGAVKEPR